jgi:hypothetical protein
MLMSRHQNAEENHNLKIANGFFENVAMFRYLGTNRNLVHEEIKSRLNSRNACHQSVHNLLSSRLLSENLKIRTYFACNFVWVQNLVSDIKGRTQAGGDRHQGILTQEE